MSTVSKLENGGPVPPASSASIVQAFKRAGVEILDGEGIGARLVNQVRS
jgi:hypothetical protein